MSLNIYAWQRYIIIVIITIIIAIIIIIISLFRNTQILFAKLCKYGKKNWGIINVGISYTIHGKPQSSYCFKETDHTSPFSVISVTVRSFHSTPVQARIWLYLGRGLSRTHKEIYKPTTNMFTFQYSVHKAAEAEAQKIISTVSVSSSAYL